MLYFPVPGFYFQFYSGIIQQTLYAGQCIHALYQFLRVFSDNKICPFLFKGFDRWCSCFSLLALFNTCFRLLPVRSGFCSDPNSANSF